MHITQVQGNKKDLQGEEDRVGMLHVYVYA